MQRTNLLIFRIRHRMTQEEISKRIPCARATYQAIESGKRDGRTAFWEDFRSAFNIPKAEMYDLMQKDEE